MTAKRFLIGFICLAIMFALAACSGAPGGVLPQEPLPEPEPTPEPTPEQYVWTIEIDDDCLQSIYGITVNSHCKASMSKVGGDDPYGVYNGELFMDFTTDLGEWADLLNALGGVSYDLDGSAGDSAFTMDFVPYEHQELLSFVNGTRETQPELAPLLEGTGMYINPALNLPEGDSDMFINMNLAGIASVSGTGDLNSGSGHADSIVGSYSASSSRAGMPCTILQLPDGRIQLTLYSTGGAEFDIKYYGTIDKVLESDTIAVAP